MTSLLSKSRVLLAGCGAGSLILFLGSMETGVGWKDSAEFVVAAGTMGIPHPPGAPLYPLLCRFFFVLSGMQAATACNAVSVFFAVLAGILIPKIVLLIVPASRFRFVSALAAWLVFLGIPGVLEYAGTAETYIPFLFTVLACTFILSGIRKTNATRSCFFASFITGIASCLHLTGVLLAVPLVALFIKISRSFSWKKQVRTAGVSFAFFLLGFTPNLYIPLRAGRTLLLDWGSPSVFKRFSDFILAREFVPDLLGLEYSARFADASAVILPWNPGSPLATAVIAVLVLAGLVYTWRWNRSAAVCLCSVFVLFAWYGIMFGGGIDLAGYMIPPAAAAAILAGIVVSAAPSGFARITGIRFDSGRLSGSAKKRISAAGSAAYLFGPVLIAALMLPGRSFDRGTGESYSEKLISPLRGAESALFITGNTVDYFLVLYQLYLNPELRSKVVPVYTELLEYEWFREKVGSRIPIPEASLERNGAGILTALLKQAVEWKVFYTPDDDFCLPPLQLRRCGPLFELLRGSREEETAGCAGELSLPYFNEQHYLERAGLLYSDHGLYCYETGRYSEALELTESAARFLPDNIEIGVNLALLLSKAGRERDALAHLDSLVRRFGESYLIHCTYGSILYDGGDKAGAAEHYKNALEINPRGRDALLKTASCLLQMGEPAAALDNARAAVEVSPEDNTALNLMGECYLEMELLDRAERAFRSVIRREPDFEHAWANLSLVYEKRGKAGEATALLREGLAVNPSSILLSRLLSARAGRHRVNREQSLH